MLPFDPAAAAALYLGPNSPHNLIYPLPAEADSYVAELYSVYLVIHAAANNSNVLILSDCKSGIEAILNTDIAKVPYQLSRRAIYLLKAITIEKQKLKSFHLHKIKAHAGLRPNVFADALAKAGLADPINHNDLVLPNLKDSNDWWLSYHSAPLLASTRKIILQSTNSMLCQEFSINNPDHGYSIWKHDANDNPFVMSRIVRLALSSTSTLRFYLLASTNRLGTLWNRTREFQWNASPRNANNSEPPTHLLACPHCRNARDTLIHRLFICPILNAPRLNLFNSHF